MKLASLSAFGLVLLLGTGATGLATGTERNSVGIDPERYRDTISSLTSDELEGRRVGTAGGQKTVEFMEAAFRDAGLLPTKALGGYRQPYRHKWHGETNAANVIGVLPGTDPELKDEVVVISAHHDGLGRNTYDGCPESEHGTRIQYGANDNASGSAALVELAFALAAKRYELKRTVVFLSTDGEECGCTGVKHYVLDAPALPLSNTIYVLNIDQIGEDGVLEEHRTDRGVEERADCMVDGEVFARRGVKAATLVGENSNYHEPTDVMEHLKFPKALELVNRAYDLVWDAVQGRSS